MPSLAPFRRSRRLLAALAAVALISPLAGCGGDDAEAADGGKPVLRVGVQKDGIRSVLTQAGLLKDLPYRIEWSEFTAGPPIIEAAAADRIDVAWVGSAPPIFGAASKAAFKVVAAVQEEDRQNDSILVPKGSPITSIADLKGKKIAVGKGTSAHGLLLNTLASAGMSLSDVEPQYLAPADGQAAFRSGAVDAWAVWDPFVAQAVAQDGAVDLTALTGTKADDPFLQFEIASSKSLEEKQTRADIAHFVGLVGKAFAWAKDNPEGWGKGWAEESGLPESVTTTVAEHKRSVVRAVTPEDIASEQKLADAFHAAGEIPEKIDFASVVEPGLVD